MPGVFKYIITMKKYKFRAWDKARKKMFILESMGFLQQSNDLTLAFSDREYSYIDDYFHRTDQQNFEIMQYTGLKDKNGVEIYENDYCKAKVAQFGAGTYPTDYSELPIPDFLHIEGLITFSNQQFRIGDYSLLIKSEEIEVVGNIYENKELVEELRVKREEENKK